MKLRIVGILAGCLSLLLLVPPTFAQSTAETASTLPRLVRFGGAVKDINGNPLTGVVGVTFALYSEQTGGAALWLETQNVTADSNGHYVALLGSTKPEGLPTDLFTSEQARWVGVQVSGQAEQPRALLVSAPYALKAVDAESLGGRPASAYLLNPQTTGTGPASAQSDAAAGTALNLDKSVLSATITGSGTKNYIPLWTGSSKLGDSILYQSTAGSLGIGTTSPAATLDIEKATGVRAVASGNGTAVYGDATVASGTGKGVEGDSSSTSGTGVAGNASATTGFTQGVWGQSASTSGVGVYAKASASTGSTIGVEGISDSNAGIAGVFNNTAGGKILSGQANGTEVFSVGAAGAVTGSVVNASTSFDLGGAPFAYGQVQPGNVYLGFDVGNSTQGGGLNTVVGVESFFSNTTGEQNNAIGYACLGVNTTGSENNAMGWKTLAWNTTGSDNVAIGFAALNPNTTGSNNTALGGWALVSNTTGSSNTAVGYWAGPDQNSSNLTNATAIGAYATVSESNALVLGSINGVNGATASAKVGIGTTTPTNVFTVAKGAGHAISDGWDTYSSRRWKTNIQTLHGALGKVEQLRGVSYDLKANGKHEVGVIAEEVGAVVPEVVTWEKDGKDAQGVDYSRLTALLIEATKEQQALIHKQQEQIKAQQMQIRAERERGEAQQVQIARLTRQVKTIQTSLKGNGRSGSEVLTVKTGETTARQ